MQRRKLGIRSTRLLLFTAAVGVCPQLVRGTANITFQSGSSFSVTHDADNGVTAADFKTNTGLIPASGSMPTPSSYQYGLRTLSNTGGTAVLNGPQSAASGSIGAYTTAQTVGFTLASGTGITQVDPSPTGANFVGYSELKFNVDATWNINASLGPTLYSDLSMTIGGTIPTGDFAQIAVNLHMANSAAGNASLANIVDTQTLDHSTPLPFPYANTVVLGGGTLSSGARVHITGTISLRAKDPGAASGLGGLLDGSQPLFISMDAAAPATWVYNDGGASNLNFSDDVWQNQMGTPRNNPSIAGDRARFVGDTKTDKVVTFTQNQTVGMIDIDDPAINMNSNGAGLLTFDTVTNDAVFWVRNTHEYDAAQFSAGHNVAVPLNLMKNLEVINDAPGPLTFGLPVSGLGGLTKEGKGALNLSASNSYAGGTQISAGVVNALADGALGTGPVILSGGLLNLNTPSPFAGGSGSISVQSNAQVGVSGSASGANIDVANLGCISGSSAVLSGLTPATVTLHNGAMIGHTSYDNLATGSNPIGVSAANLVNYTYGLSTNVASMSTSVAVGDGQTGLWGGIGGDKLSRTFGAAGDSSHTIMVTGNAHVDSLGSQLVVNIPFADGAGAPESGVPSAAPTLTKRGDGLVSIESTANSFTGNLDVESGPLAINGNWVGNAITVGVGASPASLGGTGNLHGIGPSAEVVTFGANGELHPGAYGAVSTFVGAAGQSTINAEGAGTLHADAMVFNAGAQLIFDLSAPGSPGSTGNDFVDLSGGLTLNGQSILSLIEGTDFDTTATYTLMHFNGSLAGGGNIALADMFATDTGMTVIVAPDALLGGNDVLLVPSSSVPEPCSGALLTGAGALAALRRRRRVI